MNILTSKDELAFLSPIHWLATTQWRQTKWRK